MTTRFESLDPRRNLVAAVAWTVTIISLLAAAIASIWIASSARTRVEEQISATFRQYATQISNELDINLYAKLQSIRAISSLIADDASVAIHARRILPRIKSTYPEFEWLGIAGLDGQLLASAGLTANARDVSDENWFKEGRIAAWIGDAHAQPSANPASESRKSAVALGAPIFDENGRLVAVIGAKLGLAWTQSLQTSLTEGLRTNNVVETLLVARDGYVLFGPPSLIGARLGGEPQAVATQALDFVSQALTNHSTPRSSRTSGQLIST